MIVGRMETVLVVLVGLNPQHCDSRPLLPFALAEQARSSLRPEFRDSRPSIPHVAGEPVKSEFMKDRFVE